MKHSSLLVAALCAALIAAAQAGDGDWRGQVSQLPAGNFAPLPSVRMHFAFGWSNVLEAAQADAVIQLKGGSYIAHISGSTEGLARALWPLDAHHSAVVAAPSLHPVRFSQNEQYRSRTIDTQVRFDATGLDRMRKVSNSKEPEKWKHLDFSPIYDVIGGILYVRSQPLRVGDSIGVVCFPGDSPYIAIIRVEKRETIHCMGRDQPALRLSLDIRKLEVKKKRPTVAVGYSKFRSGTIWVSDDALRLPLRAEVNVFVGFVYGELTSFEKL